jgi:glucose-6-phosphate dehydrogenase assembly protein OpcA
MLHAVGRASERVPSVVVSLLVPDVPTVVLWKKGVEEANAVLTGLLSVTDRMLIDSSEEHRPETTLLTLARMLSGGSGMGSHPSQRSCLTFCDLAWTHLTAWRSLLAQMFHPSEMRPFLDEIATVHIEYTATSSPMHSGCSQSLLLVAWLAARLRWKANGWPPAGRHGHYTFVVRAATRPQRDIRLSIDQVDATGVFPGGITSIAVTTTSGRRLALHRREDQEAIRSVTEHNGTKEETIVATLRREMESDLVMRELEVMERDAVYEEAMNMLRTFLSNTLP